MIRRILVSVCILVAVCSTDIIFPPAQAAHSSSAASTSSSLTTVQAPINWSNLTAATLNSLDASAFENITSVDVSLIPSAACAGFRSVQLSQLQVRMNKPCATMQPGCTQMIPAEAMPGMTSACITNMAPTAFASFNRSQVYNITNGLLGLTGAELAMMTPDACSGFHDFQLDEIVFDICANFTAPCTASLNTTVFPWIDPLCFTLLPDQAVAALTRQQMRSILPWTLKDMTSSQLRAFNGQCSALTADQIAAIGSDDTTVVGTCSGMQVNCALNLHISTIPGISASCLSDIPSDVLGGMGLLRLHYLAPAAMSGLKLTQFQSLFTEYGLDLVGLTIWNATQANSLDSSVIFNFAHSIDVGTVNATYCWPEGTIVRLQSALQLALVANECVYDIFTDGNSYQVPISSWQGLRVGHVKELANYPGYIGFLNNSAIWTYLSADALYALDAHQTAKIPLICINSFNLSALSTDGFSGLTFSQLKAIPESTFRNLSCSSWQAFTDTQRTELQQLYPATYGDKNNYCGLTVPSSNNGYPLTALQLGLIGGGGGLVLIVIVFCLRKQCSKRSKSKDEVSLNVTLSANGYQPLDA